MSPIPTGRPPDIYWASGRGFIYSLIFLFTSVNVICETDTKKALPVHSYITFMIYTHIYTRISLNRKWQTSQKFLFSLTSTFQISTWWKISSLVDTFHHLSKNSFIDRHCGIDTDFHDKYNFTLVWITHGPFDNLRICQIT